MKTENLPLNDMANTGNKWAVITVDETFFWQLDIIKKAERIECVYLINLHEPTNLCELSISFPAIALKNFLYNSEKFNEDELWKLEMEGVCNEISYFKGDFKANLVKYYQNGEEEEILDNEAANPSYC